MGYRALKICCLTSGPVLYNRKHPVPYLKQTTREHIQYNAVIMLSIFPKFLQNTPHSSPIKVRYGVYFVCSNFDFYLAPVTALMYAVSCHVVPCYNGTRLYLQTSGDEHLLGIIYIL